MVGAGGIGGVAAGTLRASGAPVSLTTLTTNREIAEALRARGFRLCGVDGARDVEAGEVVSELSPGTAPFDWILLATQPPQVEEAARAAAPFLAPTGAMVCLQNGLCEPRVEKVVGRKDGVVGAVVGWGASMLAPGVYERTSAGGFSIGRLDGSDDPRLANLAVLLEPIGPVQTTTNVAGARWSKLAINCAISTLGTLAGARLGDIMVHQFVRRLALEIMTEVVAVARAENVRLEKVSGTIDLDWIALTDKERTSWGSAGLVAKHSMLLAVGARFRRMRSSMLAAIERGRLPAVDFLNGEVVDRGAIHGIPTPVNAEARERVHALARRETRPSRATLEDFARAVGVSP